MSDFGSIAAGAAAGLGTSDPAIGALTYGVGKTQNPLVDAIKSQTKGLNPIRRRKDLLRADAEALANNPAALGLSEQQRQQMQSEANQAITAQKQGQVQQLNQAALAGQGFQQGGFAQAAQDVANSGAEASAKASADISALSEQKANAEANRIRNALNTAADARKEDVKFWANFGLQGISQSIDAINAFSNGVGAVGEAVPL